MAAIDDRPDTAPSGTGDRPEVVSDRSVFEFDYDIHLAQRAAHKGHAPRVIWITGLSGSGKSTLANHIEAQLIERGMHTYVLDGDSLRAGLSSDLGFTPEDRRENIRRTAEVAHLMYDAGLVVIVALISPFRVDRAVARSLFPEGDFVEVYVNTPLDVCAARDTKGLYAKSDAGQLDTMTGRGQRYETPDAPEVIVDGTIDPAASAASVIETALGS